MIQYENDALGYCLVFIILASVWIIIQCFEIINGSESRKIIGAGKIDQYYVHFIKIKIYINVM